MHIDIRKISVLQAKIQRTAGNCNIFWKKMTTANKDGKGSLHAKILKWLAWASQKMRDLGQL